ncbi:MAG TPA: hypothetical protein VFL92_00185 [Sphingomonas sp.]|nr:hypothetical protein [Sphingomonas sp.]
MGELIVFFGLFAAIDVAVTVGFWIVVGHRLARRNAFAGIIATASLVPSLILLYFIFLMFVVPDGPPPNDAKGLASMLLIGMFIGSIPISVLASIVSADRSRIS